MKKILLNSKLLTIVLVTNLFIATAIGQTNTWDGSSSNNWNTAANWSLNLVPTSAHDVVIPNNEVVTINTAAVCNSITLTGGGSDVTVSLASPNSLTVTNGISIGAGTGSGDNILLTVGSGSLSCASITVAATTNSNRSSGITLSTGSVTVSGDITMGDVNDDFTFTNNGTLNLGGTMTGGTLTPSTGVVNYNGASQDIGDYTHYRLTTSGSGTKTLTASITVTNVLTLTSGILSIPTGMQLLLSNGNVIGGAPFSSTKHIATQVNTGTGAQGFLRVNNMPAAAYLFPVGDGTDYLPATLNSTGTAANRTFSVCAFPGITTNGTPNGTAFTAEQKARCVDAVWTITYNGAGAPTSAATTVATAWPATLEGANFALVSGALIGIAHYDGPSWGTAVGLGDNGANTATRTNVTTFSPFAVGIVSPGGAPLPIKIYYFNAAKVNTVNTLNWNAECSSTQATFEIERSADGVNFTTINTITASQARCALPFSYDDNSGVTGTVFYRIKIIDTDGRVNFTSKVKVGGKQNDIQLAGILPNPVSNIAQLNVTTSKKDKVELAIISLEGKVMYRNAVQLQSGSSIISLDVSGLANGTYFVRGVFADGQTNSIKFIKQ